MFRDILVPLDGSALAEAALPLAAGLAHRAKARLHLVLAHQPQPVFAGMGDMLPPPPELDEDRREHERNYLIDQAAALRQSDGMPVSFHTVLGTPGPEICEEAGRLDADLVVMATHGRGAFQRMWLGSVADYVARHLTVPALLVPPGTATPTSPETVQSILVALDLSKDAEAILEPAMALAKLTGARITLMHVVEIVFGVGKLTVPTPVVADGELLEASRTHAERELGRVAARLRTAGVSVTTRVDSGITAAGGLLDALAETDYDLVALTTHGVGGLRRLLLGGVADKVIRGSAKPILVLRPPKSIVED